jgi:YidC/Oxa1 family membrane protein insertase
MPKKNLVVFLVFSALVVAGWGWWQFYYLEQPKPATDAAAKDKSQKPEAKLTDKQQREILGRVTALTPTFSGAVPDLVRLVVTLANEKELSNTPRPLTTEQIQQYQAALRLGFPWPEESVRFLTLGDPKQQDYFVLATISTRGGGVRNLTLPKFQKANENGRPVFAADGSKVPLQLIEDDEYLPSFLMAHYPVPTKEGESVNTLGARIWKVESHTTTPEKSELVLSFDQLAEYPGLKIVKTYTLRPKEYHITLTIELRDERDPKDASKPGPRDFRYQLAGSHGTPIEGYWYTSVFRTPMIGLLTEDGRLERDLDETQHRISIKEGGDRVPLAGLGTSMIQYAGVATQYFASLIVTDDTQPGATKPENVIAYCRPTLESTQMQGWVQSLDLDKMRLTLLRKEDKKVVEFVLLPRTHDMIELFKIKVGNEVFVSHYEAFDKKLIATGIREGSVLHRQWDDFTVRTVSNVIKLGPGEHVAHRYLLYHGPSKVRLLAQFTGDQAVAPELVDRYVDTLHLSTLTDYHSAGWFGRIANSIWWTDLLILTTRFMHWLLNVLHMIVPNYGLCIIVLTILVRGSMFPISRRTAQLSIKMQALAPEMRKIQEKFKDDPQARTAATMELYRKHGVNPLGSCLPMVLQMPFFLGLYYCLQESINFRLAGFLWIDNLAAPDMLIRWGNSIPLISDPDNMSGSLFSFLFLGPYFNILPVLAVVLMVIQQKLTTPPPADEQQEMQQKMMKYMFIFIGIMFYKVAAGLAVYFIASSLWGLMERKMLPKKQAAAAAAGATTPPAGGGDGKGGTDRRGGPRPKGGRPGKAPPEKKPETAIQRVKDWWAEVLRSAQKK